MLQSRDRPVNLETFDSIIEFYYDDDINIHSQWGLFQEIIEEQEESKNKTFENIFLSMSLENDSLTSEI